MERKFFHLPLSLQTGVIHTGEEEVSNTVAVIYSRHRERMVIRPEYATFLDQIREAFPFLSTFTVSVGDGFIVDTWDHRL